MDRPLPERVGQSGSIPDMGTQCTPDERQCMINLGDENMDREVTLPETVYTAMLMFAIRVIVTKIRHERGECNG